MSPSFTGYLFVAYYGISIIILTSFLLFTSSCSAAITRIRKKVYPRMYKVRLVQPDGSSYFIRYDKPYKIIKQAIDPANMTDEERKARMNRLKPEKPKKIYELEEEDDEGYNQRSWTDLIKKKWKFNDYSVVCLGYKSHVDCSWVKVQ